MKKIYSSLALYSSIAFSALFFTACGGGAQVVPNTPAELRQYISGKKDALRALEVEIKQLEETLGKIDTTQKIAKKVLVTTQPVTIRTFEHYVEVQGNVATAENPAVASSETGGRIVEMLAKEGQNIRKGDLVARVNLESIQKSIDELSKSMELAQDIYERQEKLWKQNIGSEIQYIQAKNQVESLQKTKERLEFELKKANVYAPASGIVEKVMLNVGEVCGPGTPIIQIVNSTNLKVLANASENYLAAIKKGDNIRVVFPALGTEQNARVSNIGRIINPANRTFEVEAMISTEGGLVKPNLLATVFIKDYSREKMPVIASELILQDVNGNNYLMLNQDGKAAKRIVTMGKSYMNETEILSGLDGTEQILVKGARQVIEGDLLEVIGEEGKPTATVQDSTATQKK
jgi:RND family efflux transporter MFP subunit